MRLERTFLPLACLVLALRASLPHAAAQGTAFTYQGRLDAGGVAASGIYDLRFALYDAASAGMQQGGLITNSTTVVTDGLFTVPLDFGNQFPGAARWLEIGVRTNGETMFATLIPRQRITATPYAIRAANFSGPVAASQITGTLASPNFGLGSVTTSNLAAGTVTASDIAGNAITAGQLASGAAAANIIAAGQSGVGSGGVVFSAAENAALVNAGYVKIGVTTLADAWLLSTTGAPAGRDGQTAVWTGSELIIWGGVAGVTFLNDGARYSPVGNSWSVVTTNGAPGARAGHTAVWTGSEMIVWGGVNQGGGGWNDGGRYNPAGDSWIAVTTNGAPATRGGYTAVWTGGEMIVWGGFGAGYLNDGGRYNPASNNWTVVTTTGAPSAREDHTAVWTGSAMLVWGGAGGVATNVTYLSTGGRYNPAGDSWTAMTTAGAPAGRLDHTVVWTGSQMVVWGGYNGGSSLNTGGRYNPAGDSWTAVTTTGVPTARAFHTAAWTGSEMVVWGGDDNGNFLNDGGRYNPAGDSWTAVSTNGAPAARYQHTAVWTGSEMIVWGGVSSGLNDLNDTWSYTPGRIVYLYQRP